jgi:hypothetical protein
VHGQTENEVANLLVQVGATAIISVALTAVTAGISDAAGTGAAAVEVGLSVSRILGWIAELAVTAGRMIGDVEDAVVGLARAAHVSEKLTVTVIPFVGRSVAYGVAGSAYNVAQTEITAPGSDLWAAADEGFVAGAAGSVLSIGAKAAMGQVTLAGNRATLTREIDAWVAEHAPEGYSVFGEISQRQWAKTYVRGFDETGKPIWYWPPKDGFAGDATPNTLRVDDVVDRISEWDVDGRFAAQSEGRLLPESYPSRPTTSCVRDCSIQSSQAIAERCSRRMDGAMVRATWRRSAVLVSATHAAVCGQRLFGGGHGMKYSELRQRLIDAGFDVRRVVYWAPSANEKDLKYVRYNIVRRGGKFILISADDHDEFFVRKEPNLISKPLEFATEDEVCEWVWAKVTAPRPPTSTSTMTKEQLVEQNRLARERLARKVPPPPGIEV